MRFFCSIAGAAFFVISAPLTAHAQQVGITYDCDTAADNFSELVLPTPEGHFTVTGRVRLNKIAKINKYVPLTRLLVSETPAAPGQTPDDWAGFQISAFPEKSLGIKGKTSDAVLQFLKWDQLTAGKSAPNDPLVLSNYKDNLPFTLTYNGDHVVTQIGDQQRRIPINIKHPVVRIICSTAEFLYTNLKIDKID